MPINIKTECVKIETDILDEKEGKDESKSPKKSSNDNYIVKVLQENMAKYACGNNTLRSLKEELGDTKNVDKQINLKKEDNLSSGTSKSKSDKIKA